MFDIHTTSAPTFRVAVVDGDFVMLDLNEACASRCGLSVEQIRGRRPRDVLPPCLVSQIMPHYHCCVASRTAVFYESEHVAATGHSVWRTALVPMQAADGRVSELFGVCTDITLERAALRAERALNEKLSLAMETIEGGFWTYDVVTGAFDVSKSLAELLAGPGTETLSFRDCAARIHPDDARAHRLSDKATSGDIVEYRVVVHDGSTRWLQSKRRFVRDGEGGLLRVVGLVIDVTAQKTTMLALEDEAHTDMLTRVKNRRAFEKVGARLFEAAEATGAGLKVVLVDLDHFKPVNDRYGHAAGDEVLRQVARRLGRVAPTRSTLARIGGDEFAILLPDRLAVEAVRLVRRIERAFAKPFRIGAVSVTVGASCGIADRLAADTGLESLLARADRALYHVKTAPRLRSA